MQKLVGVIFSVIGLGILSAFFNWGSNIPVMQWPVEAYYGLVFTNRLLSPFPDVPGLYFCNFDCDFGRCGLL